jgi:hypothetical protein
VGEGKLGSAMNEIRSHLSAHPMNVNYDALTKSIGEAQAAAKDLGHAPLTKSLSKFAKATNNAENARFFADGWGNLQKHSANLGKSMGQASVLHGLMNATFIAGAAVSDYRTVTDLHRELGNLKRMHAHLTGQKEEDVSGMGLMFGKVPEPVAQARAELMKEFGPAVVLDVANTVMNIKFAANSKFGSSMKAMMMMMALPMANSMIARGLLGGQLLPTYSRMRDLECRNEEVPKEMYEKLIGSASKDIAARGGQDSNFTKALAVFYSEHHAKADTILKEVHDGTMKKRVAQLQGEYDAYMREHPEIAQAQAKEAELKKEGSHVDRLLSGGKQMARDVVGDHTAKLATQGTNGHAHGHGAA